MPLHLRTCSFLFSLPGINFFRCFVFVYKPCSFFHLVVTFYRGLSGVLQGLLVQFFLLWLLRQVRMVKYILERESVCVLLLFLNFFATLE